MITCTFAGHRAAVEAADEWAIPEALAGAVEELLKLDDAFQFYFGGMGWFDLLCAREVRRAKLAASEKRIVEHSQHIVAYVRRDGGAAATLRLARARGLIIHEL